MTATEILDKLKSLENPSAKNVLLKHGAKEPFYGVKIEELKKIQKVVKKNYSLSLELYASGISDAIYLPGLIADETKMTRDDLNRWAKEASWQLISEYPVAWAAAESPYGLELALQWIDSPEAHIATAGWATLSGIVALHPDEQIDKELIRTLLDRVEKEIHTAPNRVRYVMNGFVISVGGSVPSLTEYAEALGKRIGEVHVELGGTACKVPAIPDYIRKMRDKGYIGKKKKTVRC